MAAGVIALPVKWLAKTGETFCPRNIIYAREIPILQEIALFIGLSLAFSLVGFFITPNEYVGWDWRHFFGVHRVLGFFPPWTQLITDQLTWPLLVGLTLGAYVTAVIRRSVSPFSAAAAIIMLPLFWTVFLGQLEGVALVGLLWMPWLLPFAVIKPQIAIFALFSRRSYLAAGLAFFLVSLLIWGLWPMDSVQAFLTVANIGAKRSAQDIGLGLYGLPIALIMLWFSRGDMDMMMFAGSLAVPYLVPYHLMVASPAVARLSPGKAIIAALISWLPFSSNWIGPAGWWLGWLFVAWTWLCLAAKRYPDSILGKIIN